MSIINDALKKTQDCLTDKPNNTKITEKPTINQNTQEENKTNKNTLFLFLIILLTLGIVFFATRELKPHLVTLLNQYKILGSSSQVLKKPTPLLPSPVKEVKKIEKISILENLKLNGIIYSEEGNAALINNNVYEENDTIEGYFIKEIQLKKVLLEKDGKIAELKTRN